MLLNCNLHVREETATQCLSPEAVTYSCFDIFLKLVRTLFFLMKIILKIYIVCIIQFEIRKYIFKK